jgi:ABC-type transport system involved in cytochrome bd biosynthesis fused ATPase/permease subunit
LNKLLSNIKPILTGGEKRTVFFLIAADALISLADIAAITALLLIIGSYTGQMGTKFAFIQQHIELSIAIFFPAFTIKNLLAFLIRKKMLQYLQGNHQLYSATDSSVHIKQISQIPVEFAHYVLYGLQQAATQLILVAFTATAIICFNARLFLLVLIILLPAVLIIARLLKKKIQQARLHAKISSEKSLQYLQEALAAYTESRIYGLQFFFTNRYTSWQQQLNRQLSGLQVIQLLPSRLIEVFAIAGFLILVLTAKYTSNTNHADVLTIGAFMAAAYRIMPALVSIINNRAQVKAYEHTISSFTDQEEKVLNKSGVQTGKPAIRFSNVSFSHNGKPVINNLSFEVQSGEMVGLSGVSGAGKTTVINLMLGILQPQKGTIDVQTGDGGIACVLQHPFILHDSLQNNIALGDEQPNHQQLQNAIEQAGLNSLAASLPDGINTIITERGKNISGGQQQRIAIARALYRNADLLVSDEPFTELDEISENKILAHFKNLSTTGKIVILATHNPANLAQCSKIITINE